MTDKMNPRSQRDREFEMTKWDEYTSLVRAPLAADSTSSSSYHTSTGPPGRASDVLQTIIVGQDPIFACCEKTMWLVVKILSIGVVVGAMLCELLLIVAIAHTKAWTSASLILDLYGLALCFITLLLEWRPAVFGHQQYSSWAAKGLIYTLSGCLTLNATERIHTKVPFSHLRFIPGDVLVICGLAFVVLEILRIRKVFRNAFPEGITTDNTFHNVRTFYEEGYITRTESYDF